MAKWVISCSLSCAAMPREFPCCGLLVLLFQRGVVKQELPLLLDLEYPTMGLADESLCGVSSCESVATSWSLAFMGGIRGLFFGVRGMGEVFHHGLFFEVSTGVKGCCARVVSLALFTGMDDVDFRRS